MERKDIKQALNILKANNYILEKNFLDKVIKFGSDSLVGKICKRIEVIQKQKEISPEAKLNLLKDLIKERIYEEFRNIRASLDYYTKGYVKGYNEEILNYKEKEEESSS